MSDDRRTIGSTTSAPPGWELVDAVLGTGGQLLVGCSPRDPHGEALVLIPPGVRIQAPDGIARASAEDWRVALWEADEQGNRHVDVGRPASVTPVSLWYVIGFVLQECPMHLGWVADCLQQRIDNACAVQVAGGASAVPGVAKRWRRDAEAMLDELDMVLSDAPPRSGSAAHAADLPELAPEVAPGVRAGDHDARLCPGALRRRYDDRLRLRPTPRTHVDG